MGLESAFQTARPKKQELEQKNAELSQALEEAKQNAEDQKPCTRRIRTKSMCWISRSRKPMPRFPNWMRKSTTFNLRSATGRAQLKKIRSF